MRLYERTALWLALAYCATASAFGQPYGKPDRDAPGDEMIQKYLAAEAAHLDGRGVLDGVKTLADWEKLRPTYRQQYLYMLGLSPVPEKTPLNAKVTGTLQGDGYTVELLHYQSRPGLYVTGNLYRPAKIEAGKRLPAVFYVCGHSGQGRDGNKTAYQSHGIWFAKHGYVCLVVDSLQLGEIAAIHHGTYREGRWWWHSRGYTPAGVECLNGIRGIDYLCSRPDVDPQRIAVTGISGGGAATFWIAAADERVKVAVPVSGMADLESYVGNRVINGHCDCMFLYNTFQWPWTRIAALIAPRAMLFTNSDEDRIFPMDANDRIINRLERVYSLYGRSDYVDAMVSIGGHAYRKDLRQAAFRFINTHLKDDPRTVEDSEVDLVGSEGKQKQYPIEPQRLRVFPQDSDIPKDELNTTIDQHFVPLAKVAVPAKGKFAEWQAGLKAELRRVVFRPFPERIPAAKLVKQVNAVETLVETEPGIEVRLQYVPMVKPPWEKTRILLVVRDLDAEVPSLQLASRTYEAGDATYLCMPRGVEQTRWTAKNPPNYVARSHVLLGRTVAAGQIWDVIATARYLKAKHGDKLPVYVAGEGTAAVLAAYAALLEPEIAGAMLDSPPLSHMDDGAPALLNVLRVCDIPDVLGMLAPRPLTIHDGKKETLDKVAKIYAAAGAAEKFVVKDGPVAGAPPAPRAKPLLRAVDLDRGEAAEVELCNGAKVRVKLLDLKETADSLRQAVREARVQVEVDGQRAWLTSAQYQLPLTLGKVQIDCPITKGTTANSSTDAWGLQKDARLRLWPAGSPLVRPGTFVYPVKQRWFASSSQMANEPCYVDAGDDPKVRKIYYHYGLDFGGAEGMTQVVAATDALVVSAGKEANPGYKDTPVAPRYDVVSLLDDQGWYYRYSHFAEIDPAIKAGGRVKAGQRLGLVGKEGGSGGWTHLHFDIFCRQPSGKWGCQEAYAFAWEAYRKQFDPKLVAVARPHHLLAAGEKVTLDGSKSWSADGRIAACQWTFTDGTTADGPRVERTYQKPGYYSEVLKVTDAAGHVAYDSAIVVVVDREHPEKMPPAIHVVCEPSTNIRAGDEVTFKVRTFRVSEGEETWDFGDGSPKAKSRSNVDPAQHAKVGYATLTHRYERPGAYLVRVERIDAEGRPAVGYVCVPVEK